VSNFNRAVDGLDSRLCDLSSDDVERICCHPENRSEPCAPSGCPYNHGILEENGVITII